MKEYMKKYERSLTNVTKKEQYKACLLAFVNEQEQEQETIIEYRTLCFEYAHLCNTGHKRSAMHTVIAKYALRPDQQIIFHDALKNYCLI